MTFYCAACWQAVRSTQLSMRLMSPASFGEGNEAGRMDESLRRVPPPDQGLNADDAGVGEADDGLIMHLELMAFDGGP